jgi:hypothetical protein
MFILQDIEYMGNQQEVQLAKLQDISRQLVEKSVLSNFIQADVAQVTTRWSKLKQQVIKKHLKNRILYSCPTLWIFQFNLVLAVADKPYHLCI